MAQTGYTPILIYSSSTGGNAPAAGNLTNSTLGSELAINITDGKLFYKDNAGVIQVIGWKVVPATAGGTGQTSYAVGDILYADTTTSLAKLADVATGNALISGGVGVAPAWGKIGLTTHVTGTLPVGNGGTGIASLTLNRIPYGNNTSAFQSSANLAFDGTTLGVGGTLSAWSGVGFVVQTPGPSIWGSSGVAHLSHNTYFDGSNYKYIDNGFVEDYYQLNGQHVFRYAASGSAGGNVSFSTAFSTTTTGNIAFPNGQGIDFSATAGTGTSELFADYEEGTWTPAWSVSGGTITSYGAEGTYTKIGNRVICKGYIAYGNATTGSPTGQLSISGLPFTANATGVGQPGNRYSGDLLGSSLYWTANAPSTGWIAAGASTIILLAQGATGVASTTYANMSRAFNNSDQIYFEVLYYV